MASIRFPKRASASTALTLIGVSLLYGTALAGSTIDPPPNDNLASALGVVGVQFQLTADLGAATREAFEPFNPDSLPEWGRTAWWTWTTPEDGIYEWDSTASSNLVAVTLYQTDAFSQLIRLASTYYRPSVSGWPLVPEPKGSFQAKQGNRYLIQLDLTATYGPIWFPPFTIESKPVFVSFARLESVAPPNDNFANRAALTGSNAVFTADLSVATGESDEPQITTNALRRTVWWTWTAPDYGTAVIRARDTNSPPVVGVYSRGLSQSLELIASSATEFGNECYQEDIARDSAEWDTAPGAHYEIQVDRFPSFSSAGPVELELAFTPPPPNDTPAGAIAIDGTEASLVVSNTAATLRTNEFKIPTQSGSKSVWFNWVAPSRGVLQVTRFEPIRYPEPSYTPTNSTGVVIVYIGPPCYAGFADLHPLPPFVPVFGLFREDRYSTNQPSGPTAFLTSGTNGFVAEVQSGSDYWIELDGDQGSSGQTPLNLLLIAPPANDDFTNRITLPSESLRVTGRTFAATREGTDSTYVENDQFLQRSVWWEWHAPAAGRWTLFVVKGGGENKFVVYRGATATTNSEIGSAKFEPIIFDCQAGEPFQIGAFALAGFGGNVEFTLTPVEAPALRFGGVIENWFSGYRSLTMQLSDNSGLPYVVERSDDLTAWTPVLTNANAWSHWITLQTELAKPKEFFRTRLQDAGAP